MIMAASGRTLGPAKALEGYTDQLTDDPSLRGVMAEIQAMRSTDEPKLDTVTTEVKLSRVDFRNMLDNIKRAESKITKLQSTTSGPGAYEAKCNYSS
ncbi:hypothetical protein NDU88_005996 [Pleurodeles waltl]|uniref:Uncharacterized protein n=1 Tax=Pleurodeles waltl TaxID=8319 RepID=A0AAV7X083_PLEWA|nr:hypothetical protein NDU88_005996 [Pleurodeles waltl]